MLNRLQELPLKKMALIMLASSLAVIVIIALALTVLYRKKDPAAGLTPPLKIQYCGENPQEVCILSFGRDGAGDAIINVFVPDKTFPDFYLEIEKAGMPHRYECKKNLVIKTNVLCSGEALSLKQTITIQMFATKDDALLATGTFFIEAFLVATQGAAVTPEAGTASLASPTPRQASPTPAATQTLPPYPNPSAYPGPYP